MSRVSTNLPSIFQRLASGRPSATSTVVDMTRLDGASSFESSPLTESPRRPALHSLTAVDTGIALLLAVGYGAPVVCATALGTMVVGGFVAVPLALSVLAATVAGIRSAIARYGRRWFQIAAEVLVLLILPAWGMVYSHSANASCEVTSCGGPDTFRPLAEPEVFVLLGLHALTVLAYAISRRRPERLVPGVELAVHALMLLGVVAQALVAVQFGPWLIAGVAAAPVFLPCVAPILVILLYTAELRSRLLRRGDEATRREVIESPASIYRAGSAQELLPEPEKLHVPTLGGAVALSVLLAGLYAVVHAAWLGHDGGALDVVTRTCGYTFSQTPIVVLPADCHYLCTVAARGHTALVRPMRVGKRGGIPILVNRQLAIANAFEDLLHERVPRFGKLARRVYDRLGLPVSRLIRSPWAADAVFLVMKPAEWLFFLVLLLCDRKSPEERIDRMYR